MEPILLFIIGAILCYIILYCIIKYAVKNAVIEAHKVINNIVEDVNDSNGIAKVTCPNCGKHHDMDYPKCPHCRYVTQ